jgi:hypothetical protein
MGICILVLWGGVLLLSLTTNTMMTSAMGTSGVFFMFAGIAILGGIFCFFFIRETKHLTDKEKKNLYKPKELLMKEDVICG